MFYNKIDKERMERLFPDIIEGLDFYEWHEGFHSVIGYEPYIPQSFEASAQHENSFRSDDRVIATEMAKYPEFHSQMIDIINMVMIINRESKMWELYHNEEYPGISFAYALASEDLKYVDLYAAFLLSVKPEFQVPYLKYDIVSLIKKWGWHPETYYLLLVYWFSNNTEKSITLNYLSHTGLMVDLKEKIYVADKDFMHALALFLSQSGYSEDELHNKCRELFEELTEQYLFFGDKEKAADLKKRYHEVVEILQNVNAISGLTEENYLAVLQVYEDDDIPEI